MVAKAVKDTAAVCTEVGGKADTTNAIKRADLNGDGIEDYVLDVGSVNCDGAASVYGDREKGVLVYVGDGKGGATEAFNDMSYGVTLEGTGPAAKLWLAVSGQRCGKTPAKNFAARLLRSRDRVECEDAEIRLRACVDREDGPVEQEGTVPEIGDIHYFRACKRRK